MFPSTKLTLADTAIFETFVVPRYLASFGELMLEMLALGEAARVAHLGCRTGYPDPLIAEKIRQVEVLGFDASSSALELARNKAAASHLSCEYHLADKLPVALPDAICTHAFSIYPFADTSEQTELFAELYRLLTPGGQGLVALPLRNSFQEILDLLREFALKNDDSELAKAVENALLMRPNIERLNEEFEKAGFEDVDIEVRHLALPFDSGRAFAEDPVTRLVLIPELTHLLKLGALKKPLEYLRDAIDKYWSESSLELNVSIGCVSGRKP